MKMSKQDLAAIYESLSMKQLTRATEWFSLALASYKMKKYGECLFAISMASPNKKTNRLITGGKDYESCANFDSEGKLTRHGQALLSYVKAKSLCKLRRYSESLFELAKLR